MCSVTRASTQSLARLFGFVLMVLAAIEFTQSMYAMSAARGEMNAMMGDMLGATMGRATFHAVMVPLIQFIAGIVVYGLSGGLATLMHGDELGA